MRRIDLDREKTRIVDFIKEYTNSSGFEKVVVGISGGIDSAVVAALAVESLGKENVFGVMLPYKNSNPNSLKDGLTVATKLDLNHRIIDITPMIDAWFDKYEPDADHLRRGNYLARIRMTVLYDLSAKLNSLVIGTGNLSELMTGYTTQYGDSACAFEPIGHLYKSEIRGLARLLDIPQSIIIKKPSADLWQGQTDEDELGLSYEKVDELLYMLFEKNKSQEELISNGYAETEIKRVLTLYRKSEFKRKMPPTP